MIFVRLWFFIGTTLEIRQPSRGVLVRTDSRAASMCFRYQCSWRRARSASRRSSFQLRYSSTGPWDPERYHSACPKLTERGVRRVFAIDIERSRLLEWSTAADTWSTLDPTGCIVEPALEV